MTERHDPAHLADELIGSLAALDATVALAESLTGGRLAAALTSVPGASAVLRGAVVAYSPDIKVQLLGVDPQVLAAQGPVCAEVAAQMAQGARIGLGATYAVSTTGEAGPESASGQPVGTVVVAVSGPSGTSTRRLDPLYGTRENIQVAAVDGALRLLMGVLARDNDIHAGPDAPDGNIED